MKFSSGPSKTRALMRDVQFHPVTDQPEHVDFQRLAAGERVRVSVAVVFLNEGTSPGLKRGGVLNVVRHTVEVACDPDNIPEKFEADLGALDINDNVRWHDLMGTGDARPTILDRDFVIATVAPPTVSAEALAEDAAAAAAAAAAPAKGKARPRLRRPRLLPLRRPPNRPRRRSNARTPRHAVLGRPRQSRSRAWRGTGTISASWPWM